MAVKSMEIIPAFYPKRGRLEDTGKQILSSPQFNGQSFNDFCDAMIDLLGGQRGVTTKQSDYLPDISTGNAYKFFRVEDEPHDFAWIETVPMRIAYSKSFIPITSADIPYIKFGSYVESPEPQPISGVAKFVTKGLLFKRGYFESYTEKDPIRVEEAQELCRQTFKTYLREFRSGVRSTLELQIASQGARQSDSHYHAY